MSKLKNIKALNEMLGGNHRTQTRKTYGWSDAKYQADRVQSREIGEIWEEKDAEGNTVCWWEQMDGYKVRTTNHPDISKNLSQLRDYLQSFPNCPKETCTCKSPTNLDNKFRRLMGMCEDCVISMETRLKIRGEFNEYAANKMKSNAEAFFKQADAEVEIIKGQLKSVGFVNSEHGDVENWSVENITALLERIDSDYQTFKAKTMEKFD